jgi:uncharacterized protein (TIGR02246 family)
MLKMPRIPSRQAGRLRGTRTTCRSWPRCFTEDVDFVNVLGSHWKGRSQVKSVHASMHKTQFHSSKWQNRSVSTQTVKPDVALVHVEWAVVGDLDPDGTPRQPRTGVFSWLLVEHEGRWLIRSAHNTNVTVLRRP